MSNNTILIILVILVLCYSFFSATETAFSSLNKIKLKALANTGNKRALKTLELSENFTSLLTTILIGNTIVNVVSASIATVLFTNLFGGDGVAISSIVMTLVIMIIGEIFPKNIAKHMPEKFAILVTPLMKLLVFIFTPLTFVFNRFENFFSKMFKDEDDDFAQEEFLTMVEEANEDGDIEEHEADLITNAIEFNDVDVSEIFTPRIDIIAIDIDEDSNSTIEKLYRDSGYSRLPVYKDSIDNVIGVIHEKEFYYYLLHKKSKSDSIESLLQPVIYTQPQVKISSLLKEFQKKKTHMAIVCDEYGGTEGLITMEDILEELVGEIYDEHDEVVEYYKQIDDNTYLVKGDLDVEDLFDHFNIKLEEEFIYNSTSAWVVDVLDKIPQKGDSFDYKNLHVEVTEVDSKRVIEIKVIVNEESQEASN